MILQQIERCGAGAADLENVPASPRTVTVRYGSACLVVAPWTNLQLSELHGSGADAPLTLGALQ